MIKIFGAAVIFTASYFIGSTILSTYIMRVNQLTEYSKFLSEIMLSLEYRPQDISQILSEAADKMSQPFKDTIKQIAKCSFYYSRLSEIWKTTFLTNKKQFAVNNDEMSLIASTGDVFSEIQKEKIINGLKLNLMRIEDLIKQAQADKKNKGQLYKRLSLLGGAALIIIII